MQIMHSAGRIVSRPAGLRLARSLLTVGMNRKKVAIPSPTTLYLPHAVEGPFPWRVLHEQHRVGAFATQDESLKFALHLAASIHRNHRIAVRMRFEGEDGAWETVQAYPEE